MTRQTRTSARARASLAVMVAGYFAIAVVAGAASSPLTVLLPAGTRPPAWAANLAGDLGLAGRNGLIGLSWVLVLIVLAAFALLVREAWLERVGLAWVLGASAVSLAIVVAGPLLLSRDLYTYAAYGRIESVYHHNPYAVLLSSVPHDPFVAAASTQWHHTHSIYGPLFTLLSAGIARACSGSVGATVLAFKLLAGFAIALATGLAAWAAARTRPGRAPLAAALVGLNPVIVVHTVGGAHVDALIAAPIAAAVAIAVSSPVLGSRRAMAITVLLTVAFLIKAVIVLALVLWLWWLARESAGRRGRILAAHIAVIAGLTLAALSPFVHGWQTVRPLATLGGVEAWASPSHLVGYLAQQITGTSRVTARVVEVAFLALLAPFIWRLGRRLAAGGPAALVDAWGGALMILPLTMPFLLPWYAAWFAPFLGLLADDVLVLTGTFVTCVLALTLIPADPFHGLTSTAVMDGVHFGAASLLLVALVLAAVRLSGRRSPAPEGPHLHYPPPARGSSRARPSP